MGWKHFLIDVESALDDEAAFAIAQDYILSGHTDWINWNSVTLVRLLLYLIARGYEMTASFICTIDVNYVIDYLDRLPVSDNERTQNLVENRIWEWENDFPLIFTYFSGQRKFIDFVQDTANSSAIYYEQGKDALFRRLEHAMR